MLGNSRYVPSRLVIGLLHPIAEIVLNGSSTLAPLAAPALVIGAIALAFTERGALALVCLGLASWFVLAGYMRFVVAQRLATREIVVDSPPGIAIASRNGITAASRTSTTEP